MIKWAGWLIAIFGAAHTLLALTVEEAGSHAGDWFSGELWGEDLAAMSEASSAFWLSWNSFGPPLVILGLMVLWLDRRGIVPPPFIAWVLGVWAVGDTVILGLSPSPVILLASVLLLVGSRRAARVGVTAPAADTTRAP
ncbi:DUF6463 family protein [Streptomyces sp. NPDC127108]|uniref:DUF6463 family protein n=1 Tax=Streptomyces sp. NPDC127108 TaxID=3345361 RepID=UPI0036362D26